MSRQRPAATRVAGRRFRVAGRLPFALLVGDFALLVGHLELLVGTLNFAAFFSVAPGPLDHLAVPG